MTNEIQEETELSKIINALNSGETKVIRNFASAHEAILFSYSLYNERRKKNKGKELKISVNKTNATVSIFKKFDPILNLF